MVKCSDFNESNVDLNESLKAIRGLANNQPGLLPRIHLKTAEKRLALKNMGLKPNGLLVSDLPIVELNPSIHEPLIRYSRKITIALFYKELQKIAPADYLVWTMWGQSINANMRRLMDYLRKMASNLTVGARKNVNIGDRFVYWFEVLQEPEALMVVAQFGIGLAFVSCVASPEARSAMTVPGWTTIAEALKVGIPNWPPAESSSPPGA